MVADPSHQLVDDDASDPVVPRLLAKNVEKGFHRFLLFFFVCVSCVAQTKKETARGGLAEKSGAATPAGTSSVVACHKTLQSLVHSCVVLNITWRVAVPVKEH